MGFTVSTRSGACLAYSARPVLQGAWPFRRTVSLSSHRHGLSRHLAFLVPEQEESCILRTPLSPWQCLVFVPCRHRSSIPRAPTCGTITLLGSRAMACRARSSCCRHACRPRRPPSPQQPCPTCGLTTASTRCSWRTGTMPLPTPCSSSSTCTAKAYRSGCGVAVPEIAGQAGAVREEGTPGEVAMMYQGGQFTDTVLNKDDVSGCMVPRDWGSYAAALDVPFSAK